MKMIWAVLLSAILAAAPIGEVAAKSSFGSFGSSNRSSSSYSSRSSSSYRAPSRSSSSTYSAPSRSSGSSFGSFGSKSSSSSAASTSSASSSSTGTAPSKSSGSSFGSFGSKPASGSTGSSGSNTNAAPSTSAGSSFGAFGSKPSSAATAPGGSVVKSGALGLAVGAAAANANAVRSQQEIAAAKNPPVSATTTAGATSPGNGTARYDAGAAPGVQTGSPNYSSPMPPQHTTVINNNSGSSGFSGFLWYMLGRSSASHGSGYNSGSYNGSNNGSATPGGEWQQGDGSANVPGSVASEPHRGFSWLRMFLWIAIIAFLFWLLRAIWRKISTYGRDEGAVEASAGRRSNYSLK